MQHLNDAEFLKLADANAHGALACNISEPQTLLPGIKAVPWHLNACSDWNIPRPRSQSSVRRPAAKPPTRPARIRAGTVSEFFSGYSPVSDTFGVVRFENDNMQIIQSIKRLLDMRAHFAPRETAEPATERRDGNRPDFSFPDLFR